MKTIFTKKLVLSYFNPNSDIIVRTLCVGKSQVQVCYIDCLIDKNLLSRTIIDPLCGMQSMPKGGLAEALPTCQLTAAKQKDEIIKQIVDGGAVIFEEGSTEVFGTNLAGYSTRTIAEPPTSQVTKGPREGFVEDLQINLSLLRRRLKSEHLAVRNMVVGRNTKTHVSLVYLTNVADKGLVKKLVRQINNMDIDGVLDSYYIESMLEQGKLKFLRRVGNSEKPDVIASRILEGRIAIVVDGSPIVLTVPYLLIEDLQSPEDYYSIASRASFLRIIRLVGLILGFLLPGIYVALQSYHYRVLPLNFLVTLLSSIQGISFPPLIEILFVLFLFDILAEASARMPELLGMALSIIGALVLGETTVQAGIISPPSIVVVAISSIMLFIVPDQVPQVSLLRVVFTVVGGIAGFYGMLMCFVILSTYLIAANGYGAPFLAPIAPSIKADKKDAILKMPLTSLKTRPVSISTRNHTRYKPAFGVQTDVNFLPQNESEQNSNKNAENITKGSSTKTKNQSKTAKSAKIKSKTMQKPQNNGKRKR